MIRHLLVAALLVSCVGCSAPTDEDVRDDKVATAWLWTDEADSSRLWTDGAVDAVDVIVKQHTACVRVAFAPGWHVGQMAPELHLNGWKILDPVYRDDRGRVAFACRLSEKFLSGEALKGFVRIQACSKDACRPPTDYQFSVNLSK